MFKIIDINRPFVPAEKVEPKFHILEQRDSQNLRIGALHRLYILESTWAEEIGVHLGWGKRTKQNRVEQGGILLGEVFHDPDQNRTFVIVQKAIPGVSAQGSPGYLSMGHSTWEEMLNEADVFLERTEYPLRIIGWYHSHPNELPVFMSGTDLNTQAKFFHNDWQFSIVINPHKQIWRAFVGLNAPECEGFVIADQSFLDWRAEEKVIENAPELVKPAQEESRDIEILPESENQDNNPNIQSIPPKYE